MSTALFRSRTGRNQHRRVGKWMRARLVSRRDGSFSDGDPFMTFEEFLNILPGVQPGKHIIQAAAKSWADYITDPNPRFVAPPLRGETQAILGQTSAVILSAPGAVGKSTVGAEIARRKYAPVVNLAARKVGTDGAVGLITKMFGYTGVASVASEISVHFFLCSMHWTRPASDRETGTSMPSLTI